MKKIFKVLLIGCVVLSAVSCSKKNDDKYMFSEQQAQEERAQVFDKINNDMAYEDVVKLIGREGEKLSEIKIGSSTTVMYIWNQFEQGQNLTVSFKDGKVYRKDREEPKE